jgi:plasmid stability protein
MTVTVTVPDELAARLQAAAAARGTSVEQLAIEMLSAVEIEPVVDSGFAGRASDTITEHQAIVDRLAAT